MDPDNNHINDETITESELEQIYLSAIKRILNINCWNETNKSPGEALITVPAQPRQPYNRFSGYILPEEGNDEFVLG